MNAAVDPKPGAPADSAGAADAGTDAPLSPVKQALLEIRDLRARLAAAEGAAQAAQAKDSEPIAVLGLGCRLPGGVHDEASLWRVLAEGIDTIGPIPSDRWDVRAHHHADPDQPGTMWTGAGGFLDDVAGFDAAFFGIAPLEAASMDPQQRLMLEVAWHALEDAGIAPDSLLGSRTGVFIGVGNGDYGRLLFSEPEHIDAYAGSGGSLAVVAGRLSYVLGLQGPALAVDTACSASLVAVHLACQSLRSGECDLALVGGINLILSPAPHIAFTKARMMAIDGRCKTFDAAADGYGRGEGALMLVLQRQRDASAAGARTLALIRGSAVNQDGRSGGLTAPNGPAQEAVIRAALANARLAPADIDVVEAHGTGTSLGDPIELQALAAALGEGRKASDAAPPLYVGSCKTNFGHLEAAAGLAGMAKAIASLRRRRIPPHLHFTQPNPLVDWKSLPLAVPTSLTPWPERGAPARAGVSSFGFSGTNAHVILEEPSPVSVPSTPVAPEDGAAQPGAEGAPAGSLEVVHERAPEGLHLLALSARDEGSLRALAGRWHEHLAAAGDASSALADLCFTASTGRAQLPQRLTVRAGDAETMREGLGAWLGGRESAGARAGVLGGRAALTPPKVAFLFTGQGAQYPGMARRLYDRAPVFRETIDRCAAVLDSLLDVPLVELIFGEGAVQGIAAARLDETAYAQPALFSVEVALAALWKSFGITPAVVLGHSLGEYAAAHVAGLFPLDDALRVLVRRGRLTQDLPGSGAMVSVQASEAALRQTLAAHGITLEFAALNGAEQVVLSGARAGIDRLTAHLDAQGTRWRALRISHAFHSSFVEPALAPFGETLAKVRYGAVARCAIVSNLSGKLAASGAMNQASYWQRQMRAPVRFAQGLATLLAEGVSHVVELGPHPVLLGLAAEEAPGAKVHWLPTLRRDGDDATDLLESLQRLFVDGARIDWAAFERSQARGRSGRPSQRVGAPLMPFNRRRYWIDRPSSGTTPSAHRADSRAEAAHVWQRLGTALARQSDQAPIGTNVTGYAGRWAALERLTVAHATSVLRDAGLFVSAGEAHTLESVRDRLGAKDTYTHLLGRWLQRLVDRGDLLQVAGRGEVGEGGGTCYVADRPLADPQLAARQDEARAALCDNPAQLEYMLHCGRLLPAVIRGSESPLETLFPGGSFELAEGIYQRSSPMRYVNALTASAIEALVAARGPARPLRAMEIGAGTGSTTASLVAALTGLTAAEGTTYVYTDVTPVFFDLARTKFAHVPFMHFAEYDLERDAAKQGFAPASFDLVIAANAVHAVRDLRAALKSIRALLAPGGVLLLVESTEHLAWYDMTTGLIEGWQHFADDLRTDNPLLHASTWQRALREAGFDETGAWPPPENEAARMGQQVIAAWVAGDAESAQCAASSAIRIEAVASANDAGLSGGQPAAGQAAQPASTVQAAHAELRERLRQATPGEQHELLGDAVRDAVARVLRLAPAEAPARHDRLMALGMDSLMAVQLRNRFMQMFGLAKPLPATLMFDHPTVEALAKYIRPLLPGAAPAPAAPFALSAHSPSAAAAPLGEARVAEMSDEEVELLLLERLDSHKQR